MDHVPPSGAAELATKTDIAQSGADLDAWFDQIDAQFDRLKANLERGFARERRWIVGTMFVMSSATIGTVLAYTR